MTKWLALIVVLISAGTWILFRDQLPANLLPPQLFGPELAASADRPLATAILSDSRLRTFDKRGQLESLLSAPQSQYIQQNSRQKSAADDYTQLQSPSLVLYQDSRPPWHLSAEKAISSRGGELVELFTDVQLWHDNANQQKSELLTSYLSIRPDQQFAETDKPVTIRSANEVTRATGMRAYLDQDRFQLLSDVRGTYEAKR